jgi:hypothetical protein
MNAYLCKIINNSGKTLLVNIILPGSTVQYSDTMFVNDVDYANLIGGTRIVVVTDSLSGQILYTQTINITGSGSIQLGPTSLQFTYETVQATGNYSHSLT